MESDNHGRKDGDLFANNGGGGKTTDENLPRLSFRDKLLGRNAVTSPKEWTDYFKEKKMTKEFVNGNEMLPRIRINKEIMDNMCEPWKQALVVCLLGKKLGFRIMKMKLANIWDLSGDFDLMDVDNGFFMVRFDLAVDREKVIGGGPWMIFDHYLAVSTWSRQFISPSAKVTKTLAWIRIPGLNPAFYDESFLMSVAQVIGHPVRVDINTLRGDRGKFARICVEIDLTKPVIGKVMLEDDWYKIEYEGLHVICTKCGCYGHRSSECMRPEPMAQAKTAEKLDELNPMGEKPDGVSNVQHDLGSDGRISVDSVINGMDSNIMEISLNLEQKSQRVSTKQISQKNSDLGESEIFGEWMIVTRKKKNIPKKEFLKGDKVVKINDGNTKQKGINGLFVGANNLNSPIKFNVGSTSGNVSKRDGQPIKKRLRGDIMFPKLKLKEKLVHNNTTKNDGFGKHQIENNSSEHMPTTLRKEKLIVNREQKMDTTSNQQLLHTESLPCISMQVEE